MRYILLTLTLGLFSTSALSQSLQDQISAVDNSYKQEQVSEEAARKKAVAAQNAKAAQERARVAKQKAEAEKVKNKEESYEDELRRIELENLKLDLQAKKTVVKRTDEYIDQELKEKAASTDYIQSNADANRNLTEGAKEKMKSQGRAEENKTKSFWDF